MYYATNKAARESNHDYQAINNKTKKKNKVRAVNFLKERNVYF